MNQQVHNLPIGRIWRLIARSFSYLDPDDRKFHIQNLREKLFRYLPRYDERIQAKTLLQIIEEETAGLTPADFEIDLSESHSGEVFDAWDSLFQFALAIDHKAPGLPAREIWDVVANHGNLPKISMALKNPITISEGLNQSIIETLPSRHKRKTFDPPPLANPSDILGPDAELIGSLANVSDPIPENACAFHQVLKLENVCIVGAEVPASLGGAIPVSLMHNFIPSENARDGYGGGDIRSGLLPYLCAKNGLPGNDLEREKQAFFMPGTGISNFYHDVVESLPALQHYLDEGLDCPIIVPELGRGALKLLDLVVSHYKIPQSRIWSREKASSYLIEEAILPPCHGQGKDVPLFYRPLTDKIVPEFGKRQFPARIYLTRGGKGLRPISNEKHIENTMERFGFEVIEIWKMTMKEQIATLANAKIIAGPFGAGLAGLVFATKGTRVIEILNHKNFQEEQMWFKRISDTCGLEHYSIIPDTLFTSISMSPKKSELSLTRLDIILNRLAPPANFTTKFRVWKHDLARKRRKLSRPSNSKRLPDSQLEKFVRAHFEPTPIPGYGSPITSTGVFLCFVNRSGSNYLAECLAASGNLPLAQEFFLTSNMRRHSKQGSNLSNFFEEIVSKNTLNDHFAAKLGYAQLALFDSLGFLGSAFESSKFIYLKRKDVLAQAISLDIAIQTEQWKAGNRSIETKDLQYSRKRLEQKMSGIRNLYENFDNFFAERNLNPHTIIYEDMVNHPLEAANAVSLFLDRSITFDPKKDKLKSQAHPVKEIWKRRFLDEK